MTIAIIEDEPLAAKNLKKLIEIYDGTCSILPAADSVDSAISLITNNHIDLIFLDIELADGSSFEIFKKINVHTPIIFTTAYDEYAIQAFRLNSIAYILKPISMEKLVEAFANYKNMRSAFNADLSSHIIKQLNTTSIPYKKHFLVKHGKRMIQIESKDIAHFKASDKWVVLITQKNEQFIVNENLTELEKVLDPGDFFRINRQYITSRNGFDFLEPYYKGQVTVKLLFINEMQTVSRKTTPSLKNWLSS